MSEKENNEEFVPTDPTQTPPKPAMSQAQQIGVENRYEYIEHDVIKLPSKGLFYPKDAEGKPITSIRVAYLTAEDENTMLSLNLIQSGEMLDVLLRNKIIDHRINPDDLLEGDRMAILYWLRSTGISNQYAVKLKDDNTGEYFEHTFDLSELDYNKFDESGVNEDGTINGTININGKDVRFRYKHLTHREIKRLDDLFKEREKKVKRQIDSRITDMVIARIVEFDGITDRGEITAKVKGLRLGLFKELKRIIAQDEPGLNTEVEVRTPSGSFRPYEIPINTEFLYPDL